MLRRAAVARLNRGGNGDPVEETASGGGGARRKPQKPVGWLVRAAFGLVAIACVVLLLDPLSRSTAWSRIPREPDSAWEYGSGLGQEECVLREAVRWPSTRQFVDASETALAGGLRVAAAERLVVAIHDHALSITKPNQPPGVNPAGRVSGAGGSWVGSAAAPLQWLDIAAAAGRRFTGQLPRSSARLHERDSGDRSSTGPDYMAGVDVGAMPELQVVWLDWDALDGHEAFRGADVPSGANEQFRLVVEEVKPSTMAFSGRASRADAAFASDTITDEVGSIRVHIRGASVWGALRGLQALEKLVAVAPESSSSGCVAFLPVVPSLVVDEPGFAHRGLLLDLVSNWWSPQQLRDAVDAAAALQLNALHLQFTGDAAFTLEVPGHSQLAVEGGIGMTEFFWLGRFNPNTAEGLAEADAALQATGGLRGRQSRDNEHRNVIRGGDVNGDGLEGFRYETAMLSKLVRYALERGVRIVPELALPGGAAAWGVAEPVVAVNCPRWDSRHLGGWGHPLGSEQEAVEVVGDVLHAVAEVFPDPLMRLGGSTVGYGCYDEAAGQVHPQDRPGMTVDEPASAPSTFAMEPPTNFGLRKMRAFETDLQERMLLPLFDAGKVFGRDEAWLRAFQPDVDSFGSAVAPSRLWIVDETSHVALRSSEQPLTRLPYWAMFSADFDLRDRSRWHHMLHTRLPGATALGGTLGAVARAAELSASELGPEDWARVAVFSARMWNARVSDEESDAGLGRVSREAQSGVAQLLRRLEIAVPALRAVPAEGLLVVQDDSRLQRSPYPNGARDNELRAWLKDKMRRGIVSDDSGVLLQ